MRRLVVASPDGWQPRTESARDLILPLGKNEALSSRSARHPGSRCSRSRTPRFLEGASTSTVASKLIPLTGSRGMSTR